MNADGPTKIAPLENLPRVQTVCLLVLTGIAAGGALYWLRPVMLPFVLALLLALALTPLIDVQMRYLRAPRSVALLATLLLTALFLGLVWLLISMSVGQMTKNLGAYQEQLAALVQRVQAALPAEVFGEKVEGPLTASSLLPEGTIRGFLLGTTNAIMDILSKGLLVLIFVFFLLIGKRSSSRVSDVWTEVEERVKRYLGTKVLTSGVTGILVGVTLSLLGIDLALVFGVFAFLLNFIPSLGSLVATLLPLPVVLMSPNISTTVAILAIAIPGAIQFAIGNFIEPRIMGYSLDLHPVVILLALILWGMLWGIVGMILATPITAVMKILFEKMEITAPMADLLAGRIRSRAGPR